MININIDKAKAIAHDKRRAKRDAEFAPLDVKATIPTLSEQAEAERQAIRDADAELQALIDAAQTVEQLKDILQEIEQ